MIAAVILALTVAAAAPSVRGGSEQDPEITDPQGDTTVGGVDIVKGWFAEETRTSFSIHLMIADLEDAVPSGSAGNENDFSFRVWFVFEPTGITYFAEASRSVTSGEQYKLYCVEFENNHPKAAHFLGNVSGRWNSPAGQVVLTVGKSMINVSEIENGAPAYDNAKTPKVGDRITSPSGEAIMWGWVSGSPPSALGRDETPAGRAYTFSVAQTAPETVGLPIPMVVLIAIALIAAVGGFIALRVKRQRKF